MLEISRRTFLQNAAGTALIYPSVASSQTLYSAVPSQFPVAGRLATCDELRKIALEHRQLAERIFKEDPLIDGFIQETLARKKRLDAARQSLASKIKISEKGLLIQEISTVVGIVLLVAGVVTTSPIVVATGLIVSVIGGTAVFGLQLLNNTGDATKLTIGYTKDRTIFFGTTLAENMGSMGGRILSRSVGVVSAAVDCFNITDERDKLEQLRLNAEMVSQEAGSIAKLLERYPPRDRNSWKAMYLRMLENSSNALLAFVEQNSKNNCLLPQPGPSLTKP